MGNISGLTGLAVAAVAVLASAVVWQRQARARVRGAAEPLETPLSRALAQIVGMAGGIYLSLMMLESFLQVEVPEKVSMWGMNLDPLAVTSLLLAVLQPLFASLRRV